LTSSTTRYRHVTFADAMNLSRRAVDLAPAAAPAAASLYLGDPADQADGASTMLTSSRPLEISPEERSFLRWLLARVQLDLNDYRPETFVRRLPACLRMLRAASPAHARALLERNRLLVAPAIDSVLIGVTSFFRDQQVYGAIERLVIPRITEKHATRVWSAGCSDGAELYSLAMLLAERGVLHRCALLGTDCRIEATRRAAAGRFLDSQAERDIPPALLGKYFTAGADGAYVAKPLLCARLQWRTADVLHVLEPGPWDLILCRNLAMYLTGGATARLWAALAGALRPGGYLVLGKAERPHGTQMLSAAGPCIYRRDRG
jgi:chemotaxis methyl-accepting protein methylase